MLAAVIILGIAAAIVGAAALDPSNRRGATDNYDDDYWGL